MTYAANGIKRVKGFLDRYDVEPADLIADIMHYCEANELDFDKVVGLAKQYVIADKESDASES